jgi:type IV pilus assembly protein PilV
MLMICSKRLPQQAGFLMLEVMIALFILVFGLIGLAGLQARAQQAENESYQRVQALMLLRDMVDRINANRANATSYVTTTPIGYGNTTMNCSAPGTTVEIDLCQWQAALIGAAETSGGTCDTASGANCVGAMIRARGCITNIGAGAPASGPFLVEVVWQGLAPSAAPPSSVTCGSGSYSDETLRRAITTVVQIANLT